MGGEIGKAGNGFHWSNDNDMANDGEWVGFEVVIWLLILRCLDDVLLEPISLNTKHFTTNTSWVSPSEGDILWP